jgi:hypothetical protein
MHFSLSCFFDNYPLRIHSCKDSEQALRTACSLAENITLANNLFSPLKPEYTIPDADPKKMSSIDWSKINFIRDAASADATLKYSGYLTAMYDNGILTIEGVLSSQ